MGAMEGDGGNQCGGGGAQAGQRVSLKKKKGKTIVDKGKGKAKEDSDVKELIIPSMRFKHWAEEFAEDIQYEEAFLKG